jgi:hypothetical protein
MSAMGLNKASHEVDEVVVPRLLSVAVDVAVTSRVVKMGSKMAPHQYSNHTMLFRHLLIWTHRGEAVAAEEEALMVDEGLAEDEDVVGVVTSKLLLRQLLQLFHSKFKISLERDVLTTAMIKDMEKIKAWMIDKIQARWSECVKSADHSGMRSSSQNHTSRF